MLPAPVSIAKASDLLLVLGAALLVGGLSVYVGSCAPCEGTPEGVGVVARMSLMTTIDDDRDPAMPAAEHATTGMSVHDADRPVAHRSSQLPTVRNPHDHPDRGWQVAPILANDVWSGRWFNALMGADDDKRGYLMRMTHGRQLARRYRTVKEWDSTSGYGSVEMTRAGVGTGAILALDESLIGHPSGSGR